MKKPRLGRPPLAKGAAKDSRLIIRLKQSEDQEIQAAADRAGKTKSEWVRDTLLAATQAPERTPAPKPLVSDGAQQEFLD